MNREERPKRPTDGQIAGMAMTLEPNPSPVTLLKRALAIEYNLPDEDAQVYADRMLERSFAELVTVRGDLRRFRLTGSTEVLKCADCDHSMYLDASAYNGLRYLCSVPRCGGTHGAHPDGSPLGVPADRKTRQARIAAHRAFDSLWSNGAQRLDAYDWLAKALGIKPEECHFALFDRARCERVIELVRLTDQALIPRKRG